MAPQFQRDSHGLVDPCKHYSLRTTKHGEKSYQVSSSFDVSRVIHKGDFFKALGLQMKKVHVHEAPKSPRKSETKVRSTRLHEIRECSVVIRGASCKICGKSFKCVTDLNIHSVHRHGKEEFQESLETEKKNHVGVVESKTRDENSNWTLNVKSRGKRKRRKKAQKRLILKIGGEVIVQMVVKLKYLKIRALNSAAHTGFLDEKKERKYDGLVGIDSSAFSNDLRAYRTGLGTVNRANRYFAGKLLPTKVDEFEDSIQKENRLFDIMKSDVDLTKCVKEIREPLKDNNENLATTIDSTNTREKLVLMDRTDNNYRQREKDSPKKSLESSIVSVIRKNVSISPDICNTTTTEVSENQESRIEETIKAQCLEETRNVLRPVETNVSPKKVDGSSKTRCARSKELPKCTQEFAEEVSTLVVDRPLNVRTTVPCTAKATNNTENEEVQEVLRISRGKRSRNEADINHESPNRTEREMLVLDAIRDMLRMEEMGYHLLDRSSPPKRPRKSTSNGPETSSLVRTIENSTRNDCSLRVDVLTETNNASLTNEGEKSVDDVDVPLGCRRIDDKEENKDTVDRCVTMSTKERSEKEVILIDLVDDE